MIFLVFYRKVENSSIHFRAVNLDAIQPKVIHKILRIVNLEAVQPKVIHKIIKK